MTQKYDASSSVVRRLPRYYRLLGELERSGQVRTSSRELGRRLGMTSSQIRQDLCCFGCFGQQAHKAAADGSESGQSDIQGRIHQQMSFWAEVFAEGTEVPVRSVNLYL